MTKTQARRAAQLQRANKKMKKKKRQKVEKPMTSSVQQGSASVMAQTCTVCTCTCRKVASVNPEKQTL